MRNIFARSMLAVVALLALTLGTFAQSNSTLKVNQTEGFAEGKSLAFTYQQQFYCTHEAFADLNHNGKVAAVDPQEFQRPICAVGVNPTIDPTGAPVSTTDKLWVLVPFFETNPSEPAFTPQLGSTLKQLFGIVPDAFKIHPGVAVQCPEPGRPETAHKGMAGTCTMHTTQLDLGPVLAALGKVPPNTLVITPTVNHSHILDHTTEHPEWWQVIVVLVTDRNAWPTEDGTKGITSLPALRAAQQSGKALGDVPSNFFLFFSSQIE